MLSHSLVVKLVAKPDRADDVAGFLASALPLAEAEDYTPVWLALRADATTFYIVDGFTSDEDREKHVQGEIAAALMASADDLLAEPPLIQRMEVLASKVEE